MTTPLVILNVALVALVFGGMLALLGWGIRSDRRFALSMYRRGLRAPLAESENETTWREAA